MLSVRPRTVVRARSRAKTSADIDRALTRLAAWLMVAFILYALGHLVVALRHGWLFN